MKKLLAYTFLACLLVSSQAFADSKISELPTAGALDGTEVVPIVQGGATKKVTTQSIGDLGGGGGASDHQDLGDIPPQDAWSCIVDDTAGEDYQTINAAWAGGCRKMYIKDGAYDINPTMVVDPGEEFWFIGESQDGTVLDANNQSAIIVGTDPARVAWTPNGGDPETVTINEYGTTITSDGTTPTQFVTWGIVAGDYFCYNDGNPSLDPDREKCYKIASVTETVITLEREYEGATTIALLPIDQSYFWHPMGAFRIENLTINSTGGIANVMDTSDSFFRKGTLRNVKTGVDARIFNDGNFHNVFAYQNIFASRIYFGPGGVAIGNQMYRTSVYNETTFIGNTMLSADTSSDDPKVTYVGNYFGDSVEQDFCGNNVVAVGNTFFGGAVACEQVQADLQAWTFVIAAGDTDCSGVTTEGELCWDTDDDTFCIGDGAACSPVGGALSLKENDVAVGDADIATIDFLGADFDLAETPDTEIQVVIAAAIARDSELHAESHTVASHSDTTATGAELETLTDGSVADALHDHNVTAVFSTTAQANLDHVVWDYTSYDDSTQPAPNQTSLTFWDSEHSTIAFKNDVATDTTHEIGQETWLLVHNATGVQIDDGSVVYINGVSGNKPTVALADADAESTSYAIGMATHDIGIGSTGWITTEGVVHGFDTTAPITAGAPLFLSSTAGGVEILASKPAAPAHANFIGFALNSTVNGSVYVNPNHGFEIAELHDVVDTLSSGASDNDIISWDTASSLWINEAHLGVADAHHTATADTNANTVCAGTTTYLDGEGGCDDISAVYAPIAEGVTNGDTHDHSGGDGAQVDHTTLSNIGTDTHATIDAHIDALDDADPHDVIQQDTDCAAYTTEGEICWDTNDDEYYVGDGAAAVKLIKVSTSATPTITFDDSDSASETSDATIAVNCTDAGAGTEDCDISIKTQVNSTLTEVVAVDADGNITIGATGQLIIVPSYERHIQIDAHVPGVGQIPAEAVNQTSARCLQWDDDVTEEYAFLTFEVPADWDGNDMTIEVDWHPDSGAIGASETVIWEWSYVDVEEGGSFSDTQETGSATFTDGGAGTAQWLSVHTPYTILQNGTNVDLVVQDHVYMRVNRDGSASDTFTGTVCVTAFELLYNSVSIPRY